MPFVPLRVRVGVEDHDGHDLAEAERHDGQVVAAQPQRRRAEQDAEDGRHGRPDDQHQPERACAGRVNGRRAVGVRVRADGEERGVAQVEQAGQANDDVQADRQQDEDAGVGEAADPVLLRAEAAETAAAARSAAGAPARSPATDDDASATGGVRRNDRRGLSRPPELRAGGEPASGRGHARSASCWPRMPVGRKISTRTRVAEDDRLAPAAVAVDLGDDLEEADHEAARGRRRWCCRCRRARPR